KGGRVWEGGIGGGVKGPGPWRGPSPTPRGPPPPAPGPTAPPSLSPGGPPARPRSLVGRPRLPRPAPGHADQPAPGRLCLRQGPGRALARDRRRDPAWRIAPAGRLSRGPALSPGRPGLRRRDAL